MRMKLNPRKEELIEALLRMGVKVGEIQVLFPDMNTSTLRNFGKSLGINTRASKNKESIENRNTKAIKRLIERSIEEGIIEKTKRVDTLLNVIDELPPTTNERIKDMRRKLNLEKMKRETPCNQKMLNEEEMADLGEIGLREIVLKDYLRDEEDER